MVTITAHDHFASAVENTLLASGRRVPLPVLADQLIREEPGLVAELTPEWQRQAIIRVLQTKRSEIARNDRERQMTFPGFEKHFNRIPKRLPLDDKLAVQRGDSTYTEARKYLAYVLRKQKGAGVVQQAREMVSLLYKHSRKEKGITWARVMEVEGPKAKYNKPEAQGLL